jgi:hypothetical protein
MVEHSVEVGDANTPDGAESRFVEPNPVATRVEVGGLDDDETCRSPPVDEGLVAVHRPGVAVGEHDDGQVLALPRCGDLHLQVHVTAVEGHCDRLDRNRLGLSGTRHVSAFCS